MFIQAFCHIIKEILKLIILVLNNFGQFLLINIIILKGIIKILC